MQEFRDKAFQDRNDLKRKMTDYLSISSFLQLANFDKSEGLPEIILVAVYVLVGNEVLNFYFEKLLMSKDVTNMEEWPKEFD